MKGILSLILILATVTLAAMSKGNSAEPDLVKDILGTFDLGLIPFLDLPEHRRNQIAAPAYYLKNGFIECESKDEESSQDRLLINANQNRVVVVTNLYIEDLECYPDKEDEEPTCLGEKVTIKLIEAASDESILVQVNEQVNGGPYFEFNCPMQK